MERTEISEAELAALLRIAEGVPGKALRYTGLDIAGLAGAIAAIEGKGQAAAAAQTALSRSLSLKAAQPRYEAFLELVPAHIAQRARTLTRSEEHTSELQSLMRISYAVYCLKKNKHTHQTNRGTTQPQRDRELRDIDTNKRTEANTT